MLSQRQTPASQTAPTIASRQSLRRARRTGLPRAAGVLGLVALAGLCLGAPAAAAVQDGAAAKPTERQGPGPVKPDLYHPDKGPMPAPRKGGSVTVHLESLPKSMNYMVENSAVTRWMLYETHEFLIQRNWETWEYEPVLAERWVEEDTLILAGGRSDTNGNILYGKVEEVEGGYLVTPLSQGNPLGEPRRVPKDQVESVQRATVFTFHLRPDVKWHDGKPFTAADVLFSWQCYRNPAVECDSVRFSYEKLLHAEVLDPHTIRFFYANQYFLARGVFDALCIVPKHLYDLRDPRHPQHKPNATDVEVGTHVNENRANTLWVGLGPYRIDQWSEQVVIAKRFDGYFDKANGGYVDEIRWRHIANDDAAMQAVINGELDYFGRVSSEDYFGSMTQRPEFTRSYYKGHMYRPAMGYVTWNLRREKFQDPRVRRAIAMSFNWEEYIATVYRGLAEPVTAAINLLSPNYDHSVERLPFDLEAAEDLLADAGWYDRDGDGLIDKDGVPFEFQFLMPTGNKASELLGQKMQENLARLGIRMSIATREWATFLQLLQGHDYDCANLAWSLTPESDPEQLWHSKWANRAGSNHAGFADPETDRLIEAIQLELDETKRRKLFHQMHAHIYGLQPYFFGVNVPTKFAMNRKVRNFQGFAIAPGYSIRRWFLADPAGSRAQ